MLASNRFSYASEVEQLFASFSHFLETVARAGVAVEQSLTSAVLRQERCQSDGRAVNVKEMNIPLKEGTYTYMCIVKIQLLRVQIIWVMVNSGCKLTSIFH